MGDLAQWRLERPQFLALLVLALAVLFLAARRERGALRLSGTVELWRQAMPRTGQRESRWAWPDWRARCTALALACGALALASPTPGAARAPRLWRVIVDAGPGAQLPAADARTSRLEWGLSGAQALLAERATAADVIEWVERSAPERVLGRGPSAPRPWPARARRLRFLPPWNSFDRPGTVWVGEHFDEPPRRASWIASGATPTQGPVAVDEQGVWTVEEGQLALEQGEAPALSWRALGELGPALREILSSWSRARGARELGPMVQAQAPDLELEVLVPRANVPIRAGRDGWSADGTLFQGAGAFGQPWLRDETGRTLVGWEVGRVQLAWVPQGPFAGPAEAPALSWARLFERAAADPPGAAPWAERVRRSEAGRGLGEDPAVPSAGGGARARGERLRAGLCALACALAGLGAGLFAGPFGSGSGSARPGEWSRSGR
jgi:hypothetical protein